MNLSGKKFGRLFVVREAELGRRSIISYHCECECGNKKVVKAKTLRSGESSSCGCYAKETRRLALQTVKAGDIFGRLTVIDYAGSSGKRSSLWECKCNCGNTVFVTTNHLTTGNTKSCGCLHKEKITGINSPKYNHNLDSNDRDKKRRYHMLIDWRRKVFFRDKYKCVFCSSNKNLNAHHIENFSSNKELRFDIDNGITMCKECHISFHKKYGYKNNTKKQLDEFKY